MHISVSLTFLDDVFHHFDSVLKGGKSGVGLLSLATYLSLLRAGSWNEKQKGVLSCLSVVLQSISPQLRLSLSLTFSLSLSLPLSLRALVEP